MANDRAGCTVGYEIEQLVISVLLVLGQAGGPDVTIGVRAADRLFDVIDTSGRRWFLAQLPILELVVELRIEVVAVGICELGREVAVGVEGIIFREFASVRDGEGSEGGTHEGFHLIL